VRLPPHFPRARARAGVPPGLSPVKPPNSAPSELSLFQRRSQHRRLKGQKRTRICDSRDLYSAWRKLVVAFRCQSAVLQTWGVGIPVVSFHAQCDKSNMTPRAIDGINRDRASFAWAMLLSLLLVFVTALARPSGLPLQPALASLAAVQGVESPAILTSSGKMQRAPDLRQAGDPDDLAFVCRQPIPARSGILTTALCTPDAPIFAVANSRPEPRAPPFT